MMNKRQIINKSVTFFFKRILYNMKLIENPVSVQDEKNIILIQFELLK